MRRNNDNSLGILGWLGIFVLLGFLIFKWFPTWTWKPKTPEIEITEKGYFIDYSATWQGDTATIKRENPRDIYIKITPKEAAEERANLTVTLNGNKIDYNCDYKSDYFCYQIPSSTLKNGDTYLVVAKNDTGEKSATLKIIMGEDAIEKKSDTSSSSPSGSSSSSSDGSSSSSGNSSSPSSSNPSNSSSSNSNSSSSSPSAVPYVKNNSCLHYEAGRCWDNYEDEMYSSGLYDKRYGYYGASYAFPDDCDSRCQDILEDAYSEGYYDN